MKTTLMAGIALLALAPAAGAADLYVPPPPEVVVFSWAGLYAGVHGGLGGGEFDYPFTTTLGGGATGELSLEAFGFFGGGQVGYNFQVAPTWIIGIEADIAASSIEDTVTANVVTGGGVITASAGTELDWFGTVRGRIGHSWDRLLIYGTGGWAFGETTTSVSLTGIGPGFAFTDTNSKSGWTVGGGFEIALTDRLSLKTEYLYLDLGEDTIFTSPAFTVSEDVKVHTGKIGLNVGF